MLQQQLSFDELTRMLAAGALVDRRRAVPDSPHRVVTPTRKTERRKPERVNFQQQLARLPTTDEQRKIGMTDTPRPMGVESQLLPTDVFKGA